jgi:hypothetical protein
MLFVSIDDRMFFQNILLNINQMQQTKLFTMSLLF